MKKTYKKMTGKQIAKLFDKDKMTNGGDYMITINGARYCANYRQMQDNYWAPVCDRQNANAIALMPDDGLFTYSIWLSL